MSLQTLAARIQTEAMTAMGNHDASPAHHGDRRLRPARTATARADEARMIAQVAALILERRQLRAGGSPNATMSVADKQRVVAIDAELDELWSTLRQTRSAPQRPAILPPAGRTP